MLDAIFSLTTLWWLLLLLYIPSCLGLIVIVLLQKGKGVGFAGAFGVGPGTEAVFGPRSSRTLPQRLTYTAAGIFMVLALVMSLLSGKVGRSSAPALLEESDTPATLDALFGEGGTAAPAEAAGQTVSTPIQITPAADGSSAIELVPASETAPADAAPAPDAAVETPAADAPVETPATDAPAGDTAVETPAADAPAPDAAAEPPATDAPADAAVAEPVAADAPPAQ